MNRTLCVVAVSLLLGCPGPSEMDGGSAGGTAGSGTAGGRAGGSATAGGSTAGGATAGGATAGGATAGGATAGGATAGGATAGGATAGGATAGGSTAGGATAGGATAGGATAGGSTAGGSTAGGSTAGGAAGPIDGGFLPISQACDALALAYCQRYVACGVAGNLTNCVAYFSTALGLSGCLRATAEAVDAGRQLYDGYASGDCIARVGALPCTVDLDALTLTIPTCNQIIAGRSLLNGACQADDDCPSTAWCRVPQGVCGGTCVARIADGAPWMAGDQCLRTSMIYEDRCRAPVDGGQYCGQSDGGGSDTQRCWPGYYCAKPSLHCQPQKPAGSVCDIFAPNECGPNTYCVQGTCRGALPLGQDCSTFPLCQLDSWCDLQPDGGVCRGLSPAGGRCKENNSCFPAQRCVGADGGVYSLGTCAAPGNTGTACIGALGDCESGLYCASATGLCAPALGDGSGCSGDRDCQSGICRPPAAGGASVCRPNYQCF